MRMTLFEMISLKHGLFLFSGQHVKKHLIYFVGRAYTGWEKALLLPFGFKQ
jgi:hypothetical protein